MANSYTELSCTEFSAQLAAKQSVPGGGGAAALTGALAAALGAMTANFTTGKKAYAQHEEDIVRMIAELEELRLRMLSHVDADAAGFNAFMDAWRMDKEDPAREAALDAATKNSAATPFAIMKDAVRIIEVLEELSLKGSKMLLSDTACGASLARAALQTASINVYANTRGTNGAEWAVKMEDDCQQMLDEYLPRAEKIFTSICDGVGR